MVNYQMNAFIFIKFFPVRQFLQTFWNVRPYKLLVVLASHSKWNSSLLSSLYSQMHVGMESIVIIDNPESSTIFW
jgi:hypothetical protein